MSVDYRTGAGKDVYERAMASGDLQFVQEVLRIYREAWQVLMVLNELPDDPYGTACISLEPWTDAEIAHVRQRMKERGWAREG